MANENVTQPQSCRPTVPIMDADDVYNKLSAQLVQLTALLEMTYGEARKAFEVMSDTYRDNYLWACADKVRECDELLRKLYPSIDLRKEVAHV